MRVQTESLLDNSVDSDNDSYSGTCPNTVIKNSKFNPIDIDSFHTPTQELMDLKYGSTEKSKYGSNEKSKYGSIGKSKYGSIGKSKYGSTSNSKNERSNSEVNKERLKVRVNRGERSDNFRHKDGSISRLDNLKTGDQSVKLSDNEKWSDQSDQLFENKMAVHSKASNQSVKLFDDEKWRNQSERVLQVEEMSGQSNSSSSSKADGPSFKPVRRSGEARKQRYCQRELLLGPDSQMLMEGWENCEYCGGRAYKTGVDGAVCDLCEKLGLELDQLMGASGLIATVDQTVPDIISCLPQSGTISQNYNYNNANQPTVTTNHRARWDQDLLKEGAETLTNQNTQFSRGHSRTKRGQDLGRDSAETLANQNTQLPRGHSKGYAEGQFKVKQANQGQIKVNQDSPSHLKDSQNKHDRNDPRIQKSKSDTSSNAKNDYYSLNDLTSRLRRTSLDLHSRNTSSSTLTQVTKLDDLGNSSLKSSGSLTQVTKLENFDDLNRTRNANGASFRSPRNRTQVAKYDELVDLSQKKSWLVNNSTLKSPSKVTQVTKLDELADTSLLTIDESFYERHSRPIVKSVFHDSDISTISTDTIKWSRETTLNEAFEAGSDTSDVEKDQGNFDTGTFESEVERTTGQKNVGARVVDRRDAQVKMKNRFNSKSEQADDLSDYVATKNRRKVNNRKLDGKTQSQTLDYNDDAEELVFLTECATLKDDRVETVNGDDENEVKVKKMAPKLSICDKETTPSLESKVDDLWSEVRACCHARRPFRDKTNILNTAFCGRESMGSLYSDGSTVDYVYTDKENGIALIERHLPSLCGSAGSRRSLDSVNSGYSQNSVINVATQSSLASQRSLASQNNSPDSQDQNLSQNSNLAANNLSLQNLSQDTQLYDWKSDKVRVDNSDTNSVIRMKLKNIGDDPGPITAATRQTYLKRLISLLENDPDKKLLTKNKPDYPPELRQALAGNLDLSGMSALEGKMMEAFQNPSKLRRWREGTQKSSFNYILLDPGVTKNLPLRACNMSDSDVFHTFISAIFYIGKGKRARPYCHLYEAIKQQKNPSDKVSEKVQHILDIWGSGLGVVSLHCFQSVIPVEAYTREACMVDAMGLDHLTNKKRGDYYGMSATLGMKQRRKMGVYLLTKSLQIFLAEGERQISPLDIKSDK